MQETKAADTQAEAPAPNDVDGEEGLDVGEIAGIVAAGIGAIAAVVIAIYTVLAHRHNTRQNADPAETDMQPRQVQDAGVLAVEVTQMQPEVLQPEAPQLEEPAGPVEGEP